MMLKPYALLVTSFILCRCSFQEPPPGTECGNASGKIDRTIKVSLNSRRNQTVEWVDTFTARTESRNSSNEVHLDVTHRVMDCDGKRVVYVKGVTRDTSLDTNEERMKFHPRCGKNIAIGNKGFTVQRINLDDPLNSAVFTNRPLRNDEIFEVRVDKKVSKFSHGIGIGITTVSPADVEIVSDMWMSPNAWMYHGSNIYSNNKVYLSYKAKNVEVLQVGDRIGVMRNEFGALHFFANGVDQGPAMSNVPQTVYGVVQLRYNDIKATIVDGNHSS